MLKIWHLSLGILLISSEPPINCYTETVKEQIMFKLQTDKASYKPNSEIRITYVIENDSETPIYIYRNFGPCASPWGTVSLQILDPDGHDQQRSGCSTDPAPLADNQILGEVRNSMYWVRLDPGEFYGSRISFRLPATKGVYQLKADLFRPSFTEKQREILNREGMRVLEKSCPAPLTSININ